MKRWLPRILICLALGAVTTVGVAWGCVGAYSCYTPSFSWAGVLEERDEPVWFYMTSHGLAALCIEMWPRMDAPPGYKGPDRTALPYWSRAQRPPTSDDVKNGVYVFEVAGGWPTRSNFYRIQRSKTAGTRVISGGVAYADTNFAMGAVVPLMPIFPGFLIDTLFYAAIWLGLFVGLGAARRTLRTRRGRCPKCAYDLRGALETGCPECGWNRAEADS